MVLSEVVTGQCAIVRSFDGPRRTALRLIEIGLVPESTVRVLGRSTGTIRVAIGDTRVALDKGLANRIAVVPKPTASAVSADQGVSWR